MTSSLPSVQIPNLHGHHHQPTGGGNSGSGAGAGTSQSTRTSSMVPDPAAVTTNEASMRGNEFGFSLAASITQRPYYALAEGSPVVSFCGLSQPPPHGGLDDHWTTASPLALTPRPAPLVVPPSATESQQQQQHTTALQAFIRRGLIRTPLRELLHRIGDLSVRASGSTLQSPSAACISVAPVLPPSTRRELHHHHSIGEPIFLNNNHNNKSVTESVVTAAWTDVRRVGSSPTASKGGILVSSPSSTSPRPSSQNAAKLSWNDVEFNADIPVCSQCGAGGTREVFLCQSWSTPY